MAAVYKKIVQLVLSRCKPPTISYPGRARLTAEQRNPSDPTFDKDVAQILESVFPRVGLARFMALQPTEKQSHLNELTNICYGIRLLNLKMKAIAANKTNPADITKKDVGFTGMFVEDAWREEELNDLAGRIQGEIDEVQKSCNDYENLLKRDQDLAVEFPNVQVDQRGFSQELMYKRQLLTYLFNVQDDVNSLREKIATSRTTFNDDIVALQGAIASTKGAVAKEEVYPRFDSVGRTAGLLELNLKMTAEKQKHFELLKSCKDGFNPSLGDEAVRAVETLVRKEKLADSTTEDRKLEELHDTINRGSR